MDPKHEALFADAKALPTMPAVALGIVRLCREEAFDVRAMSDLIAKDPVIAARVVGVANSALYGARSVVKSVQRAIVMLGANAVMTLALSFSVINEARPKNATLDYPRFWKRALLAATAGRALAKRARLDPDEVFLGSLLQDVGMLAMDRALPTYGEVIVSSAGDHMRLERLERERFGLDHASVGAWITERWELPASIAAAIAGSHVPTPTLGREPGLAECVAVSGWLADVWMGAEPSRATCAAAERALTWLNLERAAVGECLAEIGAAIPELASLFNVPLLGAEEVATVLGTAKDALVAVSLRAAQSAMRSEAKARALASAKRDVEARMKRDALTGLFARAHLDAILALAFKNAHDYAGALSVAMCDVDRFKLFNDTYGHLVGDKALVSVARALGRAVRQLDTVGRWGGEEFVAIFPATDAMGAKVVAERLRRAVEAIRFDVGDGRVVPVTLSIGVATLDARWRPERAESLLEAADGALYAAKHAGRNRVVLHAPAIDSGGASSVAPDARLTA